MGVDVKFDYRVEFLPATSNGGGNDVSYVVLEVKIENGAEVSKVQLPGGSVYPTKPEADKALQDFLKAKPANGG
jgi:hypothetical protein